MIETYNNNFTIDQIDFNTCLAPLQPDQVYNIATTFNKDPELYSQKLLFFYEKKGINMLKQDGWEQIYGAMLNIQECSPQTVTPTMYIFFSRTLMELSHPHHGNFFIGKRKSFLIGLIRQYLENINESKWDIIYSSFSPIFHQISNSERSDIIRFLSNQISSNLQSFSNEILILSTLSLAYRFIIDYEFLINLSYIGRQRHRNRDGFLYLSRSSLKTLIKINVKEGKQIFSFLVKPTNYISDISLSIGLFYKTEYSDVVIYRDNKILDYGLTIESCNLKSGDTVFAQLRRKDTWDYSDSFLSLILTKSSNYASMMSILSAIENESSLSFCTSNEMKRTISKLAWKLLMVIPSFTNYLNELKSPNYAIQFYTNQKTEYGRRYVLQIICENFDNYSEFNKICGFVLERIKEKKFSDNELRDAFDIMKHYVDQVNKNFNDRDLIQLVVELVIHSPNTKLCEAALDFLTVWKNRDIEEFLILQKTYLLDIMQKANCRVDKFFQSFRMKFELFNILKLLLDDFERSKPDMKKLFGVLKFLITSNCDTANLFKFVLENMRKVKNDVLIEFLEFLLQSLNVQPKLLNKSTSKEEAASVVDFLFNLISNLNDNDSRHNTSIYNDQLQTVSLRIFAVLCKNNDERKRILSKMSIMCEIKCPRWNYSPTTFKKSANGYCGLRNLGSTCYMNSILQQLFFNEDCRTAILSSQQSDNKFLIEIRNIFIQLALTNQASVDTEPFSLIWKEFDPNFSTRIQEDAEEFFHRLLDLLPPETTKTFLGRQTDKFQALEGQFFKERQEMFYLIAIPVKGYTSFEQSLPSVFVPQILTDNNQYHDETFGNIDVKYIPEIDSLPNTIVFLLKRFDYNPKIARRVKITDEFSFPFEFEARDYFPKQTGKYYLKGVITHSGTAQGGHYNALIKQEPTWIDFDDTESININASEFEEMVKGKASIENARCAYLLFYENNPNTDVKNITKYMTESELKKVNADNSTFNEMQAAFDPLTADFALNSNDLSFMLHYFFNVLCHSCMTELSTTFCDKIIKYMNESSGNAIIINSYVCESQKTIFEIIKSAATEFKHSIILILKSMFGKIPYNLPLPIVRYVINNIKDSISVWKTLPYFAKIIHSYLSVDSSHARVGIDESWINLILDCIQTFYDQSLSSYALYNIDFSELFLSLEILFNISPAKNEDIKNFIFNNEKKIEESQMNKKSFYSLKDTISGIKDAQKATRNHESFCKYLAKCNDYHILNQSIEKCGKGKNWILDSFINYSDIISPKLIKFESEVLLPLLIDENPIIRQKTEQLIYKIFADVPKLENYQNADLLLYGRSYVNVFDRFDAIESNSKNIKREITSLKSKYSTLKLLKLLKKKYRKKNSFLYYKNKKAERFLKIALNFIGKNLALNRMSNLFRVIHWLKVRLGNSDISNLKEILNRVGTFSGSPNIDLIELFHLYQTFTLEQFDQFFYESNSDFMNALFPDFEVYDHVARFVMFVSFLYTPNQYITCLKSQRFFCAYSYIHLCPLSQPFCYMISTFSSILSHPFKKYMKKESESPKSNKENENKNRNNDNYEEEEEDFSIDDGQLSNPVEITNDEDSSLIGEPKKNDEEEEEDGFESTLSIEELTDEAETNENEEEEINEDDYNLIKSFAGFLANYAQYSFFMPKTRDHQACYIRILYKIKSFFTPELTSEFITKYFIVSNPEHENYDELTSFIFSLPNTNQYSVTPENARLIMQKNFEMFVENDSFQNLMKNMLTSSIELIHAFLSEFEVYVMKKPEGQSLDRKVKPSDKPSEGKCFKSPIENPKVWTMAEIYMNLLLKLNSLGLLNDQRIQFIMSNFFESEVNSKACAQFACSKQGKNAVKAFTLIFKSNNSDAIFDAANDLFGFLTNNSIPIGPEIEEFLICYLNNFEIFDLDVNDLANSINELAPNLAYSVSLLSVFFKAKNGMKEYFIQNYPIRKDVLDNWPKELAQYRDLFIL